MISNRSSTWSDMPIPPGEILAEELEPRGMTQRELAASLGRPVQVVNEIVNAQKAITPDIALELEMVLGIDAQYWANLESRYRIPWRGSAHRTNRYDSEQGVAEGSG